MSTKETPPMRARARGFKPITESDRPTHVHSAPPTDSSILPPPLLTAADEREIQLRRELDTVRGSVEVERRELTGLELEVHVRMTKVEAKVDTFDEKLDAVTSAVAKRTFRAQLLGHVLLFAIVAELAYFIGHSMASDDGAHTLLERVGSVLVPSAQARE